MRRSIYIIGLILCMLITCTSCQGASENPGSPNESAAVLSETADETEAGTDEIITLTLASYGSRNLPAVKEFNLSQDKYQIELIDYSQDGALSRSDALASLNAELAKGKGPDLFYLWNMQMDVEVYGGKGYLEDLYPYIDNDPELNRSDFVQSLMKAYEIDGALYGTLPCFSVITMLGLKSELDKYSVWNFDAMTDLAASRGGVEKLLSTKFTKIDFLDTALTISTYDFVDLQAGTADFDSEYYRSVLKFCNELDENPDYSEEAVNPGLTFYCISSFMETQYYEALYGGEIEFIGYPTTSGSGHCFTNLIDQFGLNRNSEYKDAAWQFLRILMTEDYQVNSSKGEIPSNVNALQQLIEYSKSTSTYTDESGNEVENTNRGEQEGFEYHSATDAQIEQFMRLIDETDKISYAQYGLIDIVLEGAGDYFGGIKTLDEVVAITQQRASIYMAERQ